jgi:hypothetical protein
MLRKLLLTIGLSVVILAPAQASAMDDFVMIEHSANAVPAQLPIELQDQNVQALPKATLYGHASNAYEAAYKGLDKVGVVDLASGARNLVKAGGRLAKDVGEVVIAGAEGVTAVVMAGVVAPANFIYNGSEAAKGNLASAGKLVGMAYENLKSVVKDQPSNFINTKDGVVDLAKGTAKVANSLYEVGKQIVTSEPAQKIGAMVKGAAVKVGYFFKDLYSFATKGFNNTFDGVGF